MWRSDMTDAEVGAWVRAAAADLAKAPDPEQPPDVSSPRPVTHRSLTSPPDREGPWLGRGGPPPVPDRCPVAYLLSLDGDLRYVGVTAQLPRRLRAHDACGRRFDRWAAYVFPDRLSAEVFEALAIDRFRPPENAPLGRFPRGAAPEVRAAVQAARGQR